MIDTTGRIDTLLEYLEQENVLPAERARWRGELMELCRETGYHPGGEIPHDCPHCKKADASRQLYLTTNGVIVCRFSQHGCGNRY